MGYPIMLDVTGRRCVVVGGGTVAARKAAALLDAGALITVISPILSPPLVELLAQKRIDVIQTPYAAGMVQQAGAWLVFAATDDATVNAQVAQDAAASGALVNRVDAPDESDFASMAAVRRGAITLGISTDGASPALAAHVRARLESIIGEEYTTLAVWLGAARASSAARDAEQRATKWRDVIDPVLALLREGREGDARTLFEQMTQEHI